MQINAETVKLAKQYLNDIERQGVNLPNSAVSNLKKFIDGVERLVQKTEDQKRIEGVVNKTWDECRGVDSKS